MRNPHYTMEDEFLISCINRQENKETILTLTEGINNWEALIDKATRLRVTPLVYQVIVDYNLSVPVEVKNTLHQHFLKTLHKNTILFDSYKKILVEFDKKDIKVIPLKGIFLAEAVYQNIALRQLSDIDILIKEENIQEALDILHSLGYEDFAGGVKSNYIFTHKDQKHVPVLIKNGVGVELHIKPVHEEDYRIPIHEFWDNTVSSSIIKGVLFFKPELLLLHILLHLDEHILYARTHFVGYVDVVNITNFYKNNIDWDKFMSICKKYACEKEVYRQLAICCDTFSLEVPNKVKVLCDNYSNKLINTYFQDFIAGNERAKEKIQNEVLANLRQAKGIINKGIFLMHDIFPTKSYMLYRYKPIFPSLFFLYYFLRIYYGIVGLFKYLCKVGQF